MFRAITVFLVLVTETVGTVTHVDPCPPGWITYDKVIPNTCAYVSELRKYWTEASKSCGKMNASLITIESDEKYEYFKGLVTKASSDSLWIPLFKFDNALMWHTQPDGYVTVTNISQELEAKAPWYPGESRYNRNGLVYRYGTLYRSEQVSSRPNYACEKRANCSKGWFGYKCDKPCHCYSQKCNPRDLEVTCRYGCELGWMGKDCTKPKQDAAVRYFCVNSHDQGKYAHLRIDTKGVDYDFINAVDASGQWISWCNDTTISNDHQLGIVTIKIYVTSDTTQDMQNNKCAGKVAENGNYEWQVKLQEKGGIVSRQDQDFHIQCNFNNSDSFNTDGEADIKHESDFMPLNIKRPTEVLDEKKETVKLELADPADGKQLLENRIGSPVLLKISFGVGEGDVATGVIPYDCFASTPDDKKNATFLDEHGCSSAGFLISPFSKNESKTLITQPFSMFGFDGSEKVDFHCSYILCFENEPCSADCLMGSEHNHTSLRHRRSAKATSIKVSESISVQPIKGVARSPFLRRIEEMLDQEKEL